MSKRSERLFSALSGISDRHIDEAAEPPQKQIHKPTHWMRWGTAAACVTLIVMTVSIFPWIGGCGAGAEGGASSTPGEGPLSFMSYAGPVLPLTLQEAAPGLTADRTVTLDFAPWVPEWWSNQQEADSREDVTPAKRQEILDDYNEWFPDGGRWQRSRDILVKDSYTLTNTTNQDLTVTAQLPFVTKLDSLTDRRPTLTLDGYSLDTELLIGNAKLYEDFHTWADVDSLLRDGTYRTATQDGPESLADIPATVYVVTAPDLPPEIRDTVEIQADVRLDHRVTGVITKDSCGGHFDWDHGAMSLRFDLTESHSGNPEQGVLVVLGAPLEQLEWSLAPRGSEAPAPPKDVHIPVTRYETDFQSVLCGVTEAFLESDDFQNADGIPLSAQLPELTPDCWQKLLLDSIGGREELLNFDSSLYRGALQFQDFQMSMSTAQRVCWVTAQITIPAGESRLLTAVSRKEPSFDYRCGSQVDDLYSYDLMPWVDSNLTFTSQTALLEDRDQVKLARQNFGFDLEQGIKSAILDKSVPAYYLEVQELEPLPSTPPS